MLGPVRMFPIVLGIVWGRAFIGRLILVLSLSAAVAAGAIGITLRRPTVTALPVRTTKRGLEQIGISDLGCP
jgi:uncharacterized protein YcsI (UPF0317 family)